MALSAGANIAGLKNSLQQLITQLTLSSWESQGSTQNTELLTLVQNNTKTLITGTEQQENTA